MIFIFEKLEIPRNSSRITCRSTRAGDEWMRACVCDLGFGLSQNWVRIHLIWLFMASELRSQQTALNHDYIGLEFIVSAMLFLFIFILLLFRFEFCPPSSKLSLRACILIRRFSFRFSVLSSRWYFVLSFGRVHYGFSDVGFRCCSSLCIDGSSLSSNHRAASIRLWYFCTHLSFAFSW